MKRIHRLLAAAIVGAGAATALGVGCATTTVATLDVIYTDISVYPESFLGDVACSNVSGAMQSYVVTLYDLNDPAADLNANQIFPLSSTPPTPCNQVAAVGAVVPGHLYTGEIDGYTQPACQNNSSDDPSCILPLEPLPVEAGALPLAGARTMTDRTGKIIPPTWTTICGNASLRQPDAGVPAPPVAIAEPDGGQIDNDAYAPQTQLVPPDPDEPTLAIYQLEAPLRGCQPLGLTPSTTTSSTGTVVVDVNALVTSIGCVSTANPGGVNMITVTRTDIPQQVAMPFGCPAASGGVPFTQIPLHTQVSFQVLASLGTDGATPTYGTTCTAFADTPTSVPASCAPLTTTGSLTVHGADVCPSSGGTYTATLSSGAVLGPIACPGDATFPALTPAPLTVAVSVTATGDTSPSSRFVCQAALLPGQDAVAACSSL